MVAPYHLKFFNYNLSQKISDSYSKINLKLSLKCFILAGYVYECSNEIILSKHTNELFKLIYIMLRYSIIIQFLEFGCLMSIGSFNVFIYFFVCE